MLVSNRCKDRFFIMVGANAEARIVDVRGNMVWPGSTTPRPIPIHRRKLYEAVSRKTDDRTRMVLISSS